jgi:hypothetical protein
MPALSTGHRWHAVCCLLLAAMLLSQPLGASAETAPTAAPGTVQAAGSVAVPASEPPAPPPDPVTVAMAELRERSRALEAANADLASANDRLTELNTQLRQEVESLALELQAVRSGARLRSILTGAALVLLGLLAGVLIKARPRRGAWS